MAKNLGEAFTREILSRTPAVVATVAALKAVAAEDRFDGQLARIDAAPASGGGLWRFMLASSLTGDDQLIITPTAGSGRWLRMPGAVDLAFPIAFGTADAAVLYTMPTGARLKVDSLHWEVTADWTGGTASAIGVSTTKTAPTNWSTKGDLLGGAGGDVEATLVAATGIVAGTIGADMDTLAKTRGAIWVATNIFRFDRITSAFTAGTGFVHVLGDLLVNNGA